MENNSDDGCCCCCCCCCCRRRRRRRRRLNRTSFAKNLVTPLLTADKTFIAFTQIVKME
jgi:hypothetical protein